MRPQPPWTGLGNLQADVSDLQQKVNLGVKPYEVSEIRSRVDALERTVREIRATIDGLGSRLQEMAQGAPD